jgi:hypothetical protein
VYILTWVFTKFHYEFDEMSARNSALLKEATCAKELFVSDGHLMIINNPDVSLFYELER